MNDDDPDQTMKLPDPGAKAGANPSAGELLARALNTPGPSVGGGRWTPPAPEELAALLPQYQIESLLGHGGMGAVYKGRQAALDRPVAIKLLPAEMAADAQFIARFQREARTLAKLQHPGIVAVHDFGQTSEGHLYFVMEFVDGTDLHRILHAPGGLNPAQALELISQICDALHYAHGKGVIHRDIKPGNILVTTDSRAKLADFGLARPIKDESTMLTGTNVVMGTAAYMAPEQHEGRSDQRADIYALGVMLYEMLCGQRPSGAFDPPSHRVQVDVRLDEVVIKAMQQAPERRYQQVSEMKTDVDRIRTTPPKMGKGKGKKPETGERKPESNTSRTRVAAIIAACLALVSAGGFFIWERGNTARAPEVERAAPSRVSSEPDWSKAVDLLALFDPKDSVLGPWSLENGRLVSVQAPHARAELPYIPPEEYDYRMVFWYRDTKLPSGEVSQFLSKSGRAFRWVMGADSGEFFGFETIAGKDAADSGNPTVKSRPPVLTRGATHTSLVEVRNDGIKAWLDGELVAEWNTDFKDMGGKREWALSNPRVLGVGSFRTALTIEKLEVREVTGKGTLTRPLLTTAAPVPAPTVPLEPGAIRLWDTPEKLTGVAKGATWKDDAFSLPVGYVLFAKLNGKDLKNRDSIVRFSVRMNREATDCWIAVRNSGPATATRQYKLAVNPRAGEIHFRVHDAGEARTLKSWAVPRSDAQDEWIRLELRSVGEEFTVSVDGKLLGTVRDATLTGPGMMILSAATNASFRDIVYVPLDKVEVGAPAAGNTQKWVDARQDAEFAKGNFMLRPETVGWAVIAHGATTFAAGPGRDGAVRMRAVFDPKDNIGLIARSGGTPNSFYKANVLTSGDEAGLNYLVGGIFTGALNEKGPVQIKRKLPVPIQPGEEYEIELRAVGDLFTVRLNGEMVLESRDPERATGKFGISFRAQGKERRIVSLEYLDLSGSAPTTQTPQPASEVRSFGGHRYQMIPGAWKWDVAKAKAEAMGGHLLTINSKEEDEFVRQAFADQVPETKNIYLGASRENADAPWRWVTGEPFAYSALPQNRPGSAPSGDDFPTALVLWREPRSSTVAWHEHTQRTGDRRIGFIVEWDDDGSTKPSGPVTPNGAATATKDAPFVNTLGMKFVPVPITGGPTGGQRVLFSVWETRVQDFRAFAKDTNNTEWIEGFARRSATDPVTVRWQEATSFCTWLTDRERQAGKLGANERYRLPSDHEWSCAAGIGEREDPAQTPAEKSKKLTDVFPWGSAWPPAAGAGNYAGEEVRAYAGSDNAPAHLQGIQGFIESYKDSFTHLSPAGSFPPNGLGLHDLGGNLRELCEEWADGAKRFRVTRGGSWMSSSRVELGSSHRSSAAPTASSRAIGLRVVLAPVAAVPAK